MIHHTHVGHLTRSVSLMTADNNEKNKAKERVNSSKKYFIKLSEDRN